MNTVYQLNKDIKIQANTWNLTTGTEINIDLELGNNKIHDGILGKKSTN